MLERMTLHVTFLQANQLYTLSAAMGDALHKISRIRLARDYTPC